MQRLVDPCREMHADELAVSWTMYPEGHGRALRKVEARCSVSRLGFLKGMFFGPISTFGDMNRWQPDLQPTIDERIRQPGAGRCMRLWTPGRPPQG